MASPFCPWSSIRYGCQPGVWEASLHSKPVSRSNVEDRVRTTASERISISFWWLKIQSQLCSEPNSTYHKSCMGIYQSHCARKYSNKISHRRQQAWCYKSIKPYWTEPQNVRLEAGHVRMEYSTQGLNLRLWRQMYDPCDRRVKYELTWRLEGVIGVSQILHNEYPLPNLVTIDNTIVWDQRQSDWLQHVE